MNPPDPPTLVSAPPSLEHDGYAWAGRAPESLLATLEPAFEERLACARPGTRRGLADTTIREAVRHPAIAGPALAVLGPHAVAVRVILFDKTPERSWAVPWHRDRCIAVASGSRDARIVEGVPQVVAAPSLLRRMVAIRLHLDAAGDGSGALVVVPGSHALEDLAHTSSTLEERATLLCAERGDVLLMRPLLTHRSGRSTTARRRVLHIELAPAGPPAPHEWHDAVPVGG